ncbi:MAG: DUF4836 family protein [Paludibacteraceae bacterium]|nr:DUF4836 family protein [Paludibacteraceae bacterium]
MKNKIFAILAIVTVAIAAIAFFFMHSKKDTDTSYQNIIPKDASLVASIDLQSLNAKADLEQWAKANKRIKKYIDSPEDLGIDYAAPVFVFLTHEGDQMGIACSVANSNSLEAAVNKMTKASKKGKAVTNIDGLKVAKVNDADIFFNSNTALILFCDTAKTQAVGSAKKLFALGKDDRYIKTTEGVQLLRDIKDPSCKNDIMGILDYSAFKHLPQEYHLFLPLPSSINPENVRARIFGNFTNGEAALYYKLYGTTAERSAELKDYADKLHPLKGDFTNLFDKNCVAFATVNLNENMASNGLDRIYEYLKSDEDLKFITQGPNTDKTIEKLKSIATETEGDAAIAIGYDEDADFPISISVASNLKSTKFLSDANYWMNYINKNSQIINAYLDAEDAPSKLMEKVDANNYAINLLGTKINLGVNSNIFYITTKESAKAMLATASKSKLAQIESDLMAYKQKYGFVVIDFENIKGYASDFSNFGSIADICNHLVFLSPAPLEGFIKLDLTDKEQNALKCLLNQIF